MKEVKLELISLILDKVIDVKLDNLASITNQVSKNLGRKVETKEVEDALIEIDFEEKEKAYRNVIEYPEDY